MWVRMMALLTLKPLAVLARGQEGVDAVVVVLRAATRTTEERGAGIDAIIHTAQIGDLVLPANALAPEEQHVIALSS
jgi:hypothetical protein